MDEPKTCLTCIWHSIDVVNGNDLCDKLIVIPHPDMAQLPAFELAEGKPEDLPTIIPEHFGCIHHEEYNDKMLRKLEKLHGPRVHNLEDLR